MVKHLLFLLISLAPVALVAQQQNIVKFDKETIHLGKIKKGAMVSDVFTFTNITDEEVEIDIVSTCDCTEANWTAYPLQPGESGKIEFTFDSNQKDKVEPIDIDVHFVNADPKTGYPIKVFLQYTFEFE